jgi:hypothetical protein
LDDTIVMEHGKAPTPVKPISPDASVQRFAADASEPSVSLSPAEGLELTAAAPVPDVTIIHEDALETTVQGSDAPTIVLRDPALIDVQSAVTAFPTHFVGSEPPASEAAGHAAASDEEFEARLKAAMSSYSEASSNLPPFAHAETGTPSGLHESAEESFEPRVEEAAHSLEKPPEQAGDISLETSWSTPTPSSSLEHAVNALEHAELERTQAFEIPGANVLPEIHSEGAPIDAVSGAILKSSEPKPAAAHETDDAVIEQVRESFSEAQIDSARLIETAEPAPMAMAAAASAAPAAAPTPLGHEAELEISRALAAAVESEAPSAPAVHAESDAISSDAITDANKVAAAVERVMKRELPNLIWKIMAELDLGKR